VVTVSRTAFDDWVDTFDTVYATPDSLGSQQCPNCSQKTLRLVLVLHPKSGDRATAAFWCDSCLTGIILGRTRVREGLRVIAVDESGSAPPNEPKIPNYRLVPPSS
jgi:hypothetical protein